METWHVVVLTVIGFPDPFAVATLNGEQTKSTGVIKKTLNPYWNESFDMCARARISMWSAMLTIAQESK